MFVLGDPAHAAEVFDFALAGLVGHTTGVLGKHLAWRLVGSNSESTGEYSSMDGGIVSDGAKRTGYRGREWNSVFGQR
jgi:hypothetical protein